MIKRIGHLHVLTDETVQNRFSHLELARRAIAGGADTIQLREKRKGAGELVEIAGAVRRVCREADVPFIVNDRVDVALAVDADGVHLGRNDLPIAVARRLLGPGKIIGGTASRIEEAIEAQEEGADYVGFGHIYATKSKQKHGDPKGPAALRPVCSALRIPVVAIGGIEENNLGAVLEAGAWGIAVIASVCAAPDPARAASILRTGIDERFGRAPSTHDATQDGKRSET
jgi:thiamine-phosphate pyrophosphorylase